MLPLNALHFTPKNPEDQRLGKLTDAKIKYLENSATLTLDEKGELLSRFSAAGKPDAPAGFLPQLLTGVGTLIHNSSYPQNL